MQLTPQQIELLGHAIDAKVDQLINWMHIYGVKSDRERGEYQQIKDALGIKEGNEAPPETSQNDL